MRILQHAEPWASSQHRTPVGTSHPAISAEAQLHAPATNARRGTDTRDWLPPYRAHPAAQLTKETRKQGEGGAHLIGNSHPEHSPSAGTASTTAKSASVVSATTFSPTSTGPQTLEERQPTPGQRPRQSAMTLFSCPGAFSTTLSWATGGMPGRTVCTTTDRPHPCTQGGPPACQHS